MLEFKELEIQDKSRTDELLHNLSYRLCEYSFGDLFIWRKKYDTKIAFEQDYMFIKFVAAENLFYLFPAGSSDKLEKAVRLINEDAVKNGQILRIACVTPEMKVELENIFPDKFDYEIMRDSFDYIYDANDLITLAGRKLHSKRNHISRFEKLGAWRYEEITSENIIECEKMSEEWFIVNGSSEDFSLNAEHGAVNQAFKHYFELGLSGGLIKLEGRIVAFTLGQKLCNDTFIVHIEKAFSDVEGAYTVINREFAAHKAVGGSVERFAFALR